MDLVRWLMRSESYPERPAHVEHVETHVSHVFLTPTHAYKLKKPLQLDFLDYSTVALREQACREEVRLNRRLAPETYLGVIPITQSADGDFELAGEGPVVDWLVYMRRLPTELTLEALHQRGELTPEHVERLAQKLITFYAGLPPIPITPVEYRRTLRNHVLANRAELLAAKQALSRDAVARAHGFQLQLLQLQPELFDERVRSGRVVEGHGDLRPEHVCFTESLPIFDCIEFSTEYRRIDPVDELAFLWAECDFLGARWVGPALRDLYQERAGDRAPAVLWDFYRSYRSCVRAKVAVLRAAQVEGTAQVAALADAKTHLRIADECVKPGLRPLVIVVGGLSGSGKSTLAKELAMALGAEVLRTDEIRLEFSEGEPSYTINARQHVYDALMRRAAAPHEERVSIVLDGTFSLPGTLDKAWHLFGAQVENFLAVECVCAADVARQRIQLRRALGQDPSDALPETHDQQRHAWHAWPTDVPQIRVDSEQPLNEQVAHVLAALQTG